MAVSLRPPVPRSWLRLPRRTARLRLTLLYSGMFLVLGTAVIVITYLLVRGGSTVHVSVAVPKRVRVVAPGAAAHLLRASLPTPPVGAKGSVVQQHLNDLNRLLAVSWFVLAITTVFSALLGWFASGRVLRPVREMTDSARTISAGNLHQRLALAGPDDEFKRLGDTFDDLLTRLESSFEAQRRFVANASHELRTPLTFERTLLQVVLADPDASAATLRSACEELLASGREQELLLEGLLTLASSERGLDHREPLDLATLAEQALRTDRPEIGRRSLRVVTSLAGAPMSGDPALVQRLIANLIDNAVRYNDDGGSVEVRTWTTSGCSHVSVVNTGPVVAKADVERLFEPFQRLGRTRMARVEGGHGLGLSIVRAIATAHGGTVTATPRTGGGLEVTASFFGGA